MNKLSPRQVTGTDEFKKESAIKHPNNIRNNVSIATPIILPTVQSITTEIPNVAAVDTSTNRTKPKKVEELAWRITPSPDYSKLFHHYLMLSKIRLTCKYMKWQ